MKSSARILLWATLVANLVLAVMLWRARTEAGATVSTSNVVRPERSGPGRADQGSEPRVVSVPADNASLWQALARNDYRACIAALRAAGCPEETIRDIIIAVVSREFRSRISATQEERLRNFKWWRLDQDGSDYDRFLAQDLRHERDVKLTELLGDDWNHHLLSTLGFPAADNSYWGFVSREKRQELEALNLKYARLEDGVQRRARGGYVTDGMEAEKKQLAARKREELGQMLTPRELEDWDLRHSAAAAWARQKLPEARSEEEFRAFVKLAQSLDKDLAREHRWDPDETPEQQRERRKDEEQMLRIELAKIIGEERAANLFPGESPPSRPDAPIEEQAEPMRKELVRMAAKEGVSAESANQVHHRLVAIMKQMEAQYGKLDKVPKEKQPEIEKMMKAEMEKVFVAEMGEKGLVIFKKLTHDDE